MTGPFSQPEQKSSGDWREEGGGLVGRGRRGWRTRSETKVLEQFPEDELELRKMVDKWINTGEEIGSVKFGEMTGRPQGHTVGCGGWGGGGGVPWITITVTPPKHFLIQQPFYPSFYLLSQPLSSGEAAGGYYFPVGLSHITLLNMHSII